MYTSVLEGRSHVKYSYHNKNLIKELNVTHRRWYKSTNILGDVNTPFLAIDRIIRQQISKDKEDPNINQQDLIDVYRTPTTAKYTFLLSAHRTLTKPLYILGHKTNLNTFKILEIIQSKFLEYNGIKGGINNRKSIGKSLNIGI